MENFIPNAWPGLNRELPKHTPGPWIYSEADDQIHAASTGLGTYKKGGTIAVAIVSTWGGEPPLQEAAANARLIAAAPELLAALELALEYFEGREDGIYKAEGIIKTTIAKAKGGQ